MIDPALLRSGRLEKHIEIPPPGTEVIVGILRHHLGNDLGGVVATAPPEATQARVTEDADAVLPDKASDQTETGTAEPAEAKGTDERPGTADPSAPMDGSCHPPTAPITRTEALESASQSAGDASHGNV